MADIPNGKMTGSTGSDTTFNTDVQQNLTGNFADKTNANTEAVKKENEALQKLREELKKVEDQSKNTMATLLSFAKNLESDFNGNIANFKNKINTRLTKNTSRDTEISQVRNVAGDVSEYINELRNPENILDSMRNNTLNKMYDDFADKMGSLIKNNKGRFKTFNGDESNFAHLLMSYDTLKGLGYGDDSNVIRQWVESYKGSALKGNITDTILNKAKKGYSKAGLDWLNPYVQTYMEAMSQSQIPLNDMYGGINNIIGDLSKGVKANIAKGHITNGQFGIGMSEDDIANTQTMLGLEQRKKSLLEQIEQTQNRINQLIEQSKNAKQEEVVKEQSITNEVVKQNEEKRKEAGLNTQANANLDTQLVKEQAITNEKKKQNTEQQQANNTWGNLLATTASRFQNLGQEIGYNMSGFFITMRNMASTIYSVRNIGRMIQSGMSATETFNAQRYRFERYDTTGASGNSLLMNAYAEAQRSRGDFESSTMLAQRILSTGVTNGNGLEAIRLAGLIDRASYLGGSTAQEARSAKLQLSQGLASNQLGGDELRSIRENAIGLTEMLAKGLTKAYSQGLLTDSDFANVGIGDLKELGKKAKLTAKTVTTAISVMEDEINEGFSKMPEQFSQTINKLTNSWNKIMYELNNEGRGLARITKLVQDFQKWLDTTEGKDTISALAEIVDKFIEMITHIATILAKVVNFAKPVIPILTDIAKWAIPLSLGSKLLFGTSRYNPITNTMIPRAGMIGIGGLLPTLSRLLVPNKEVWNAGTLDRVLSAPIMNGKGEVVGTQVGGAGLIGGVFKGLTEGLAKQFGATSAIGKLATTAGKLLGPIGIIAGLLSGAIVAFKYFDKKAENKYFDTEKSKFYNYSTLGLNEENTARLDKMRDDFLKQYTNTFGFGAKATYTQEEWQKFDDKLYIESHRLLKEQIELEKKALEAQQQTAENTRETLELTDDFIRGIKDMRTRSFRGELAIANRGYNNEINLTVQYTGDVADFSDKVLQAINDTVVPAMQNTIPVSV